MRVFSLKAFISYYWQACFLLCGSLNFFMTLLTLARDTWNRCDLCISISCFVSVDNSLSLNWFLLFLTIKCSKRTVQTHVGVFKLCVNWKITLSFQLMLLSIEDCKAQQWFVLWLNKKVSFSRPRNTDPVHFVFWNNSVILANHKCIFSKENLLIGGWESNFSPHLPQLYTHNFKPSRQST